jgi:hypothetical protein
MISIVDPEQLKIVLRPTVYAAAFDALSLRMVDRPAPSERGDGWANRSQGDEQVGRETLAVEFVTSSRHSG